MSGGLDQWIVAPQSPQLPPPRLGAEVKGAYPAPIWLAESSVAARRMPYSPPTPTPTPTHNPTPTPNCNPRP